jgi:hypothetical protein
MPAPSSPAPWATTAKPPPVSSAKPAVNGADTLLEITQGHYHARPQPQLAAVDYASPPGSHPGSLSGYRVSAHTRAGAARRAAAFRPAATAGRHRRAMFQPRRTSGMPAKARPRDKAAHSSVPGPAATRENAAQVNVIHLQATMYTLW